MSISMQSDPFGVPDPSGGVPQSTLLAKIHAALESGSSGNRQELFEARERLLELQRVVGRGPWKDLEPLCRATSDLLGKIVRYGALEESEGINLAKELTGYIEQTLHRPAPMMPQYTAPPADDFAGLPPIGEPNENADSFQLVNESRLGEILVKMNQIDGDQLDRALVLQKVTRKKLGEVLVTMEAITLESLDQALSLQRQATLRLADGFGSTEPEAAPPTTLPSLPGIQLRPPAAS